MDVGVDPAGWRRFGGRVRKSVATTAPRLASAQVWASNEAILSRILVGERPGQPHHTILLWVREDTHS